MNLGELGPVHVCCGAYPRHRDDCTAGPPNEIVGCDLFGGGGEMPPSPPGALVYLPFAPGGSLYVREDGYLRLGPGAEIRALEGGGFTITVPGEAEFAAADLDERRAT